MRPVVLVERVNVRAEHAAHVDNPGLPRWAQVWCWAWANADEHGHARTAHGELRRALGSSAQAVSAAIADARRRGLLDPTSSSRCLVLVGHSVAPCEVEHRAPR